MAHNIDMTNGRANMAFLGSRADIWHGLGQAMPEGADSATWLAQAGLQWSAVKVPAFAKVDSLGLKQADGAALRGVKVEGAAFVVRSDNGHPLGYVSDQYQPVQPAELIDWFERYISVDSRFKLDTMGSLKKGEIIWAMASFADDLTVAGDAHKARLLMTTSFDGSMATINKATLVRVVCNNTLDASLADRGKATIRTRHSTKFDAAKVAKELAAIAQGFEHYKAMGTALASAEISREETAAYFRTLLDIPLMAKADEISGRKRNAFDALAGAYRSTVQEGTPAGTRWAALNAVTRYVDHDKLTRGGESVAESRVLSANFGSGAAMKAKAVELMYNASEAAPTKLADALGLQLSNPVGMTEVDGSELFASLLSKAAA